jgi:site-specific DNA recombinase
MWNSRLFNGNHEPLVGADTFETVQALLAGKRVDRINRHVFQFSRIATCVSCGYSLIAERKKGHVYYRCHNRPFKNPPVCPSTSVREESIDQAIINCLADVDLTDEEVAQAYTLLGRKRTELERDRASVIQAQRLQFDRVESRLAKLMDLLMDGTVEKTLFNEKQNALLVEKVRIQETLAESRQGSARLLEELENTVELAKRPSVLYKVASAEKRRELVKTLLSNLTVSGKNIDITLALPFRIIRERAKHIVGRPYRGSCRTWEDVITRLLQHFTERPAA